MKSTFDKFDPLFVKLVRKFIVMSRAKGIKLKFSQGLRAPSEQAKLWRRSRNTQQIEQMINRLEESGATYLAGLLKEAGVQYGPWATNALPGESWHQWGEAVDFLIVGSDGEMVHDGDDARYETLGETAREVGLVSGYFWKTRDSGHVQLRHKEVREIYEWAEIDRVMRFKFG